MEDFRKAKQVLRYIPDEKANAGRMRIIWRHHAVFDDFEHEYCKESWEDLPRKAVERNGLLAVQVFRMSEV